MKKPSTLSPDINAPQTPTTGHQWMRFIDRNGAVIQTLCAVLGIIIALLMLWSLEISRRQFESSIEPRLDITPATSSVDLGPIVGESIHWREMDVTNALKTDHLTTVQHQRLKDVFRSLSRSIIRNAGAVAISDVRILMVLEASLDDSGMVTNAIYQSVQKILTSKLSPNEKIVHDFRDPALDRLIALPREQARSRVVCYVIQYRRSIDMKPKCKLILFEAWRLSPTSVEAFAMPKGFASLSYYPDGRLPTGLVKNAMVRFLEQLDVISPVDDQ